jgi:tol-pal system protein YbgF
VNLRRIVIAPATVMVAGACATRSDMQVLQNDLAIMRSETARADSAHRAQLDRVTAAVTALNDSVRTANTRVYRFQGDVQQTLYSIGQQLLAIQELTGQTQRRMQEFRSQVEQQQSGAMSAGGLGAPPVGAAPAGPAAPPGAGRSDSAAGGPPAPGPNQLYQLSLDQLRRGSAGAARAGFEDLVRRYPTSDLAPEAQFYIAESYAAERNMTAADSAYAAVAERYPDSPRAPTALFKYALSLQRAGRLAQARQTLDRIVQKYPRSDEAELARDRLRSLR